MNQELLLEKLQANIKVDKHTNCWVWMAWRSHDGYGRMRLGKKKPFVHRVMYELIKGKIKLGLFIDHLCRNRACCNPDHLEPVTLKVNILRGDSFSAQKARQTHCKYNHPLSGDNLVITKDGHRHCKICKNALARKNYWRNKK